jgi:hypothetical protein
MPVFRTTQRPLTTSSRARADLPKWYPRRYDLVSAAKGARAILRAQGEPFDPPPTSLTFTDADLTYLKTTVGDVAVDKRGRAVLNPETNRPIVTRVGANPSMGDDVPALVKRHPELKKQIADFDYSAWEDPERLLHEQTIPSTLKLLRAADRRPGDKQVVVTARVSNPVLKAMVLKLREGNVQPDGIFSVWNDAMARRLKLPDNLDTPQRKALTLAASILAYDPEGTRLKRVRFIDDTDDNLRAAMQLLPKLFPHLRFEFMDVVHTASGTFRPTVVARSGPVPGALIGADGKAFGARQIQAYASADAPL